MENDIYKQKIAFLTGELERIGTILSDQRVATGILLTIAGLFSFLPQLIILNNEYLPSFLSWTFWLLVIAIATYYPASLRVSSIIKGYPFVSIGSPLETEILKNMTEYLDLVWRKSVENHDSVLLWNSISKSFLYAYFFSLVTNLYVFAFYGNPELCVSLLLLIGSLLVAISLFTFPRMKSVKGKIIGNK